MKSQIALRSNKMGWLAVGLIALQLLIKLTLEIDKAVETSNVLVISIAVLFTLGWVAILALCIFGYRIGYWFGAVWGLLHFVLTVSVPMTGICDHYLFAAFVASHGILISAACIAVIIMDEKQGKRASNQKMGKKFLAGYLLLCVSTLVRTLWITFREPVGASHAQIALAGKGGLAEIAANSLLFVIIPSMVVLCAILPGIVMRKRWAFVVAAIFGGFHVIATVANVVLQVNQGFGPWVVIPASLGMLIGGIVLLNEKPSQPF